MAGSPPSDELLREHVRREAREVADALALADELDRQARLLLHGDDEPALGRAVELGEHEAGHSAVLDECLGLREAVLAGRRVEHQEHFADRRLLLDDPLDLAQLVHQPALGVEAARGVDEHDLGARALGVLDGLERDRRRVLALALGPHDLGTRALGPGGELVDRRGTERVCGADDDAAAVRAEEAGELADRGGLADPVDADHEHDRRALGQLERRVVL